MISIWRAIGLPIAMAGTFCNPLSVAAQAVPGPTVEETGADAIVVTGETEPPLRREVFDQALRVSRVASGRMYEEALARFVAPLCPGVLGLAPELAKEMSERIRANAAKLDVPLAHGRCSPNLLVAFVDDGQIFLADLARSHPGAFRLVTEEERNEILAETAPVRVWNMVETKWADGRPLAWRLGRRERPSVRGRVDRMFLPTRKDIEFALVAYDREAVLGMTVVQLADYATMRGLSHTRPANGNEPMATILALFDDDAGDGPADRGPDELTTFDLGYLRSVYFWRPDRSVPAVGRLLSVRRRAVQAQEEALEP